MQKWILIGVVLLSGCATGSQIKQLHIGMSRAGVISEVGAPDGDSMKGNAEVLTYADRLVSGWKWDRANYVVVLKNKKVVAYGPPQVVLEQPNIQTLLIAHP